MIETVDVIIAGAGPCGVTVAAHLGMYGVRTALLDRAADIIDYPRAVGMDDEALRSYQAVGLADELLRDMIQNTPVRYHASSGRCFAHVNPQGQPFGWPRRNMFLQPLTETTLRRGLQRFPSIEFMPGHELTDLSQDESGVNVTVSTVGGQTSTLRASYLVGADGGRSTVRKLVDINLVGHTQEWRWLVIDVEDDDRFAPFSGVYCHPTRPHMSIDLPYGYRRFEFRLMRDETDAEMENPEAAQRLLAPYFPKGRRPRIKRSRIYQHHSRTAEAFRRGRVFLAGDAAHLQPPFFGQGMNSGIRDATNLAWKLAAVLKRDVDPRILDSYDSERRDHAAKMVKFATSIGSFYAPRNYFTEACRNLFFRAVQSLPNVRDYILQMRFKPLPRYLDGVVVHLEKPDKDSPVGRMFMQPAVETADRRRVKMDDAIGNWFVIIGIDRDPVRFLSEGEREFWKAQGARFVMVHKSRANPGRIEAAAETIVLDDVAGAFRDWIMQRPSSRFIFLRPDRYVAAICDEALINTASQRLRMILQRSRRDGAETGMLSLAQPA